VKSKALIVVCYMLMVVLIIGLIAIFAVPRIFYNKLEATPMNVWIVDKTVPNPDYREHEGLIWLLKSQKIVSPETNDLYRDDQDYYGFFPGTKDKYTIKDLPQLLENPQLIYLADTYGVYEDDYLASNVEGKRSKLLYGGLTDDELVSIKDNLGGGNTIIGEFNIASAPTNFANRQTLSEIFRLDWSGWSGRYFQELSKGIEVPTWVVDNYEKQSGKTWDFSGEGFILVNDAERVVVMDMGKDVKGMSISFGEQYEDEFMIRGDIPYDYWFEFTNPDPSAQVLANYTLELTEAGKAVLNELGLPATFPAIIRSVNSQYTSYYFAGDFADRNANSKWWNFYGFSELKSKITMANKGDNSNFYWKCYVPMMEKIIGDIKEHQAATKDATKGGLQYNARTSGSNFQIKAGGNWQQFFAKGVNIGSSIPGTWFTEFSDDEAMYLAWLEDIGQMNANCIRVYTLLAPQFYNALAYYNQTHPDDILWLYQEIWPEEKPDGNNYLKDTYNEAYASEIKNVIDAMHGQANIPERKDRAYGIYTSDVSPYIAGYLVGREIEPEEVISTNELNPGFTYNGEYLYCESTATPAEAWLAQSCDYVLSYEAKTYNWQHPVGIVSWPTLDPKEHDSEWNAQGKKDLEYNDRVAIDINHLSVKDTLKAGFFGAYHIYPNYPDFMNNEQAYAAYTDAQGSFRYGGYLEEFISGHKKYPALVAEFGLATGMGNAHSNPDGYNHGGQSEEQQGAGIVRMMKAIKNEGYAGGIIFEWSDEWAKKTWITEPYIIPFERNPLWHNAVDPEQNYGILAMESAGLRSDTYTLTGGDLIKRISLSADETYLHIEIDLQRPLDFTKEKLLIGLDTYGRNKGNLQYSPLIPQTAESGLEFVVNLSGTASSQLLVEPSYNVTKNRYSSQKSDSDVFAKMLFLTNKERVTKSGSVINAIYQDQSKLTYGVQENNSHNNWYIIGTHISLRLPWTRLNFTDPSTMTVLDDKSSVTDPVQDQLKTTVSDGILVSGLVYDMQNQKKLAKLEPYANNAKEAFTWESWDVPTYQARLKASYATISDYFASLDVAK